MIKKYLTSNYNKHPKSNVSKLNTVLSEEIRELKYLLNNVDDYNSIEKAKGKGLDLIGGNIKQLRGETTDEVYRALIRTKIVKDRADGTLNSLLKALALSMDMKIQDIYLEEGVHPIYPSVVIKSIPFDTLNRIGLSMTQLAIIVDKLIGAGIMLESLVFDGTFEYVDQLYVDMDTGYADVDMINGGTYGDVFKPEKDDSFPI